MKDEDIGKEFYDIVRNNTPSYVAEDNIIAAFKKSVKEEVSWDEAFDEYAKSDSKTIFTRWAESKFNLVRKTREEISAEENANEEAAERRYERLMEGGDTPTKEQMMAWQKLK